MLAVDHNSELEECQGRRKDAAESPRKAQAGGIHKETNQNRGVPVKLGYVGICGAWVSHRWGYLFKGYRGYIALHNIYGLCRVYLGFPRIKGTLLEVPTQKAESIWGRYWICLFMESYHIIFITRAVFLTAAGMAMGLTIFLKRTPHPVIVV